MLLFLILISSIAISIVAYLVAYLVSSRPKKVLFTMTTFFDFPKEDKWAAFCNAMDSVLSFHPGIVGIANFIVVNEYSPNGENWSKRVREKYPFVKFIQKTSESRGQCKSLNMILSMIGEYVYWIHWEEAWFATRRFLFDAVEIMERTNISQLQFTKDHGVTHWHDKINICYSLENSHYCIISQQVSTDSTLPNLNRTYTHEDWMNVQWPLYSIRPSINRVSDYDFGPFSEDPDLWPLKFEIEFGHRWMKNGNVKAIFADGPVTRKGSHVSTYH